jgi:hypothetical protein
MSGLIQKLIADHLEAGGFFGEFDGAAKPPIAQCSRDK